MSRSFLQSEGWEAFQRSLGHQTDRIAGQLLITHPTALGAYQYCPRPLELDDRTLEAFSREARVNHALFVRIDPDESFNPESVHRSPLTVHQARPTQPQHSLVLDLSPGLDDLMASFHEKTRYNIRLAGRKEVVVTTSRDPASRELLAFLELAKGTGGRQQFHYHPAGYYRTMLEVLGNEEAGITASCLVAWHEKQPVAALILLIHQEANAAYYLHGASSYHHRQLMAPHLLQWEAIQQAKAAGCARYDFWGITTSDDPTHPWAGITRFKRGFGGSEVSYQDSFDLVVDPARTRLYRLARSVRRRLPF